MPPRTRDAPPALEEASMTEWRIRGPFVTVRVVFRPVFDGGRLQGVRCERFHGSAGRLVLCGGSSGGGDRLGDILGTWLLSGMAAVGSWMAAFGTFIRWLASVAISARSASELWLLRDHRGHPVVCVWSGCGLVGVAGVGCPKWQPETTGQSGELWRILPLPPASRWGLE